MGGELRPAQRDLLMNWSQLKEELSMLPEPFVEYIRGPLVESIHYGSAAVVDPEASVADVAVLAARAAVVPVAVAE